MKLFLVVLLVVAATAEKRCEPYSVFKDYCNTCHCGANGKSRVCTAIYCDPAVWNKDGTLKSEVNDKTSVEEFEQICEPGSVFKNYCNTCRCSKDGKDAACTLMGCDPRVWNKDGTRKTRSIGEPKSEKSEEQDCEPHSTFKYYCNTCTCGPNGKIGACTDMHCDPAVWNRDGSLKSVAIETQEIEDPEPLCEPGTTFSDGCNACHCSPDGKTAACTKKACERWVLNKDGTWEKSLEDIKESRFFK